MNVKEMTGLQLLEAMCAGKIPTPSISATIPMQPYQVTHGSIHFKAKADHRHLNPLGGVHGGFAATVLDSQSQVVQFTLCLKRVSAMAPLISILKCVAPFPKTDH